MKLPIYQIDAFADQPFTGNPAAVCPLDAWLPDELMQSIAGENNLSETAFFVAEGDGYRIRWFTPTSEVDLCGHATLATAYVLFHCLDYDGDTIAFASKSGRLTVMRDGELLVMNFPAQPPVPCDTPEPIRRAFGIEPAACLKSEDYLVVFEHEAQVLAAEPDLEQLRKLDARGVIITAPSTEYDFVSRFFAPKFGIDEDPVTGSAHCILTPYWAKRLNKSTLQARQLSKRGGEVMCELKGERVSIAGRAVLYLQGEYEL
jgi:PhzF family phenazine biosynthesis protein